METSNVQTQIRKGREALSYFHNRAAAYPIYTLSFEELIAQVGKKSPDIFLEGLGFSIEQEEYYNGGFGTDRVQKAMERLADMGQGKIPSSQTVFFQAISNEVQNVSFVEATKYTVMESAKDIAGGLQEVGNAAIDTLSSLKTIGPLLIVAGVIFIFWSKVKKAAA